MALNKTLCRYHLGMTTDVKVKGVNNEDLSIRVSLMANPSHLEAVNPVLHGKVSH